MLLLSRQIWIRVSIREKLVTLQAPLKKKVLFIIQQGCMWYFLTVNTETLCSTSHTFPQSETFCQHDFNFENY